jgi:hypothetical protein
VPQPTTLPRVHDSGITKEISRYNGDIRKETHGTAENSCDGDIETENSTETTATLTLFAIFHSLGQIVNK